VNLKGQSRGGLVLAATKPMPAASRSAVRRTVFMIKLLHQLFVLIVADCVILERSSSTVPRPHDLPLEY
jgi:hypothetical protein